MVFDADPLEESPEAPPKFNDAVTVNAFADVAGLFSETRTTNVVPATYVPLPVWAVGAPVIVNIACALIVIPNAVLGPALSKRAVISSLPETVAVIDSDWLAVPATIVIRKSMYPAPLIVLDADPFAVTPATSPLNDAVTVNAFAEVAGLLNETRTTNIVPATYVPLPAWNVGAPVIVNAACALIAMTRLLVGGFNARLVISSVPDTVVVIVTVGWLAAPASIVIKKLIYAVPLTVFDADEFAEMPVAPPNDKGAVTASAFADVDGLLNDTRTTNVVPAIYVPFPLKAVILVITNVACALIAMIRLLVAGPNDRPEYSSVPVTVVVIVTVGWLAATASIVTRKSIYPVPLIVFDAEMFAEIPDAPPNVSGPVTVSAFAYVAGLLNETRTTTVVPAT